MISLLSMNSEGQKDDASMIFKKILAKPEHLNVYDRAEWKQPVVGDKVEIVSWDTQSYVQECVRLSKLSHLTVSDVMPIVIGVSDKMYYWAYEICVEESNLTFLQWHYKIKP